MRRRRVPTEDTIRAESCHTGPRGHALFLVNDLGLRIVPLPASGTVVVGRGSDADVRVADMGMSRRHVRIHLGPSMRIEDLDSANGTSVGGDRLSPGEQRVVADRDAIMVGTTTMLIRSHEGQILVTPVDHVEPMAGNGWTDLLALTDRAAASMISVLLLGETGVGKDVMAERIHRVSPRAGGAFLRVNCAAFSPALFASELFGHEKGAFTGATSSQPGLLQSASGGTVFLDEVGDLPLELQAKLLIVVERREVLPVGALRPRPLDVRFISATNRSLPQEVEAGMFRRDLYFRLNGITIEVPPLRARVAEIAGLAMQFAREAARSIGKPAPELSSEALAWLRAYAWPGNVRELRTVMERAVLLAAEGTLRVQDVALAVGASGPARAAAPVPHHVVEDDHFDDLTERQYISSILARCGGNQSRAAKLLGMSRNTLIARIEKYGLIRPLAPRGR